MSIKLKDFKGRASEPAAIMQTRGSDYGMGMNVPVTTPGDGMGRFRDSPNTEVLDNPGFQVGGYITKKGLNIGGKGADVRLNFLPPGMYIDNQENADIRPITMKNIVDPAGYPGDGWSGASEDMGI